MVTVFSTTSSYGKPAKEKFRNVFFHPKYHFGWKKSFENFYSLDRHYLVGQTFLLSVTVFIVYTSFKDLLVLNTLEQQPARRAAAREACGGLFRQRARIWFKNVLCS